MGVIQLFQEAEPPSPEVGEWTVFQPDTYSHYYPDGVEQAEVIDGETLITLDPAFPISLVATGANRFRIDGWPDPQGDLALRRATANMAYIPDADTLLGTCTVFAPGDVAQQNPLKLIVCVTEPRDAKGSIRFSVLLEETPGDLTALGHVNPR